MKTWHCPHCGESVTLEGNCGNNLVPEGQVVTDLLGQQIHSHCIGNCYACWGIVEVINGALAMSLLMPVIRTSTAALNREQRGR